MKQALPPILLAVFLLGLLPGAGLAQIADATLSGVIVDQNYAAISGASVTLLDKARARVRQLATGADGTFSFALLPPGAYLLRENFEGFSPVEVEVGIDAFSPGNLHRALRIQMQISQIGEIITVTAPPDAPAAASAKNIFAREFIERLPLSGQTLQ